MTIFFLVSVLAPGCAQAAAGADGVVLLSPALFGDGAEEVAEPAYNMLTTRLSSRGFRVFRFERSGSKETLYERAFDATGADFLVDWSITRFADSLSMDIFIRQRGAEEVKGLYSTFKVPELIPSIDGLAERMSSGGFLKPGKERVPAGVVPGAAVPVPQAPAAKTPLGAEPEAAPPVSPGKVTAPEEVFGQNKLLWKGEDIEVRDAAMGDLDGDGRPEIVLLESAKVHVLGQRDGTINIIDTVDLFPGCFSVSILDVNKNGRPEVFISAYDGYIKSLVLEWSGEGLKVIVKRLDWFLRTIDVPGRGTRLFGQRAAFNGARTGRVYELEWNGSEYVSGEALDLPEGAELYNFAFMEIEGRPAYVVHSEETLKLSLYSIDGRLISRTGDRYGGSLNTYEADYGQERNVEKLEENLHGPLEFRVLQKLLWPGEEKLLVVNNIQGLTFFKKHSNFKAGELVLLAWDGIALEEVGKSTELPFYVAAALLGDVDGDGALDAVTVGATNLESLWGTVEAFVVAFPFHGR